MLITTSNQYGLTRGGYTAEFLELTDEGRIASGDESQGLQRLAARLRLAIERIAPFMALYERFANSRLPTTAVLRDAAIENGSSPDAAEECVETFLANARDLGLLKTYAGAERLLTFQTLLDELEAAEPAAEPPAEQTRTQPTPPPASSASALPSGALRVSAAAAVLAEVTNLTDVCFLIAPIGSEESIERKHSDLVLGSLIEPAIETLGLRLVRADRISRPGMITTQVIEHLVRAPLVVADLSFGNPNVYYELALRHAIRKPVVQIIRSVDHLPFDVGQFRTVVIDMTDIYALVPQIDTHRAEIARQCRAALDAQGLAESPLSLFYPRFWEEFGRGNG